MFFKKLVRQQQSETIPPALAQAIENAILLGDVRELDEALTFAEMEVDFPKELRYGLEALRHFRAHYGAGKPMEPKEPLQKQKATVMEIAWGAELLDLLHSENKIVGLHQA